MTPSGASPSTAAATAAIDDAPTTGATRHGLSSIELFSGAGGLALGVEAAGFRHLLVNEINRRACETLQLNGARGLEESGDGWPLIEGDVAKIDWSPWQGEVDLLAGGAPCQPFSISGLAKSDQDPRNMFPEVFRAVRELRPRAVLIENVPGLQRPSFLPYLDYITDHLAKPLLAKGDDETWRQHRRRILAEGDDGDASERYVVSPPHVLNAADFGVPQMRRRLFLVAFRADLGIDWHWPAKTHSDDALLWDQIHGTYWSRHGIRRASDLHVRPERIERVRTMSQPAEAPWATLRDALTSPTRLPKPVDGRNGANVLNHVGIPGARLYHGHKGSPLDRPAKAIKAGVHGSPGGEHILVDGDYFRYLTVRECARVQTIPDDWAFVATRTQAMKQLGNAVPVALGRVLAEAIANRLNHTLHLAAQP